MIKRNTCGAVALFFCMGVAAFCLQGLMGALHDDARAEQVYALPLELAPQHAARSPTQRPPPPCQAKLAAGSERFSEQIAWLHCPDTVLDYPVVQGADNAFYLHHLADGTANSLGAIFLDAAALSDFSAPVSSIYGHRVASGQMFETLTQYRKQTYYDLHPTLWLCTEQIHYAVDVLAAYLVSGNEMYPQAFQDEDDFSTFVRQAEEKSFFKSTVTPQFGERLLILSTCDYGFKNARLTILGRLRPTEHANNTKREDMN